jgi:hypothetical protein
MNEKRFFKIERWCPKNGCFKAERRLYSAIPDVKPNGFPWRIMLWNGDSFIVSKEGK